MACYETCVDKGKKCTLCTEKITCSECGGLKPHYNFPAGGYEPCKTEQATFSQTNDAKPQQQIKKQDIILYKDICVCKQTCWEWILSFLGIGGKLPECCKDVSLTPWESGEVARVALTTKVQHVVHRITGRGKYPHVRRSSTVNLREDPKEAAKQQNESDENLEEVKIQETEEEQDQSQGKKKDVNVTGGKGKHKRSRRSRSKERGSFEKSSQGAQDTNGTAPLLSYRNKSRSSSRSRSLSKVFNPFQRRHHICGVYTARYSKSPLCPPLPCPQQSRSQSQPQPKSQVAEAPEDRPAEHPGKGTECSAQDSQRTNKKTKPCKLIRSNSMPCKSCAAGAVSSKPSQYCKCVSATCGSLKLPYRSNSFHSMLTRSPTPRVVVLPTQKSCCRPCVVSTGRPKCRQFKSFPDNTAAKKSRSPKSCCCTVKSSYCSPPPNYKSCGAQKISPCLDMKSPCSLDCTQSGCRQPINLCPPCCIKPCCLPIVRKFTVLPYCPRPDTLNRRYLSLPSCSLRTNCPCPPNGACACPSPKPLAPPCCPAATNFSCKMACSTPTVMSYIKARQNDAICNQLLAKYGFSIPAVQMFPAPCYGGTSEGLCTSSGRCQSDFSKCTGTGGCISCLPPQGEHEKSTNNEALNTSNSRCFKESEDHFQDNTVTQFKSSPSGMKPICTFNLLHDINQ